MRIKWAVSGIAVLALVVVVAVVVSTGRTRVPTSTTSTSMAPSTSTTQFAPMSSAVWPSAGASLAVRSLGPVAMATHFGREYLGMSTVYAGPFQQGDTRSGEVVIRTAPTGPQTTVLLRQLGVTGEWSVIGAATADINFTTPVALERISSPVLIRGRSTAFEGVITVQVRADDSVVPLASTQVIGGSMGVVGPFHTTLTFDTSRGGGAVVGFMRSAKDGSVMAGSVLRVLFP